MPTNFTVVPVEQQDGVAETELGAAGQEEGGRKRSHSEESLLGKLSELPHVLCAIGEDRTGPLGKVCSVHLRYRDVTETPSPAPGALLLSAAIITCYRAELLVGDTAPV